MSHYKDLDGKVHFLDSAEQEHLLPEGSVAITDNEAATLSAPPADVKVDALIAMNESLAAGFTCPTSGIKMQADYERVSRLENGYQLALRSGSTDMQIRDYDNGMHTVLIADVNTMLIELGGNYDTLLKAYWTTIDA